MEEEATPQLENGYTRIANEILEAVVRYDFTASELRVLMTIIRHTYGWGKKTNSLSVSFLIASTGMPPRSVSYALSTLKSRNVIWREGTDTGILKNHRKWRNVPPCKGLHPPAKDCTPLPLQPVAPQQNTIKNKEEQEILILTAETMQPFAPCKPLQTIKKVVKERNTYSRKPSDDTQILSHLKLLWTYYLEKLGKAKLRLEFTPLKRLKGTLRFRECLKKTTPPGDFDKAHLLMEACIDVLAATPWNIGENPNGDRYDSWEKHLFGTTEKLETWLQRAVQRDSKNGSSASA